MALVETEAGRSRVYLRSQAIFRTCAELAGAWRMLAWLRFLPRALAEALYRGFARRRYRWFGKLEACRVPDAGVRGRFLP
jgi:predicted DCC family thiol-disulfide oxidoreductase YuxK